MVRRCATVVALCSVLAVVAGAQTFDRPDSVHPRRWIMDAWASGGPTTVAGGLGGVPDRHLLLAGLSIARPLVRGEGFGAEYFGQAIPLTVATRTPLYRGSWFYSPDRTDSLYLDVPAGDRAVLGAGIMPLGVRLSANLSERTRLYTDVAGGAVLFARAVPDRHGRALNFIAAAGAGLELGPRMGRSVLLGYRFAHISNAYTAERNQGLNAHLFYLGIRLR